MDTHPILNLAVNTDHLKLTDDTVDLSDNQNISLHFWQGSFLEQIDFTISESGGTVTGSLEKEGTGDLTMFFSDEYTVLDCTPAVTVNLTSLVGTDTAPAAAFVYIPQSTKTLTAASSWPIASVEHIRVASIVLQGATTTGTEDALMNRNWNDEAFGIDDTRGGGLHITERLRFEHALWNTGIVLSVTGSGTGTVTLDTTSGTVYQMHLHIFPVVDMAGADNIHLVNLSGSEYSTSVNLVADITTLANGSTALSNNKYFNIVVWGVQNRTGETSHLMCNLPIGQYTKSADATVDSSKFSVHTIPTAFRGTGFLIAELTFQLTGGGSTWTLVQNKDLLGQTPTLVPGGGTTTNITTFSDSQFEVFDNGDDAKRFNFEVSGITTGNTRILTVPDVNTTMWADDGSTDLTGDWIVSTNNITLTAGTLTAKDLVINTNLIKTDSGNSRVGINRTPSQPFDVIGDTRIVGNDSTSGAAGVGFDVTGGGGFENSAGGIVRMTGGSGGDASGDTAGTGGLTGLYGGDGGEGTVDDFAGDGGNVVLKAGPAGGDGGGGAGIDGVVRLESDTTLITSNLLVPSGSRILLTEAALSDIAIGSYGNVTMYFEAQADDYAFQLNIFKKNVNAAKNCSLQFWAKGTLTDVSNYEAFFLGYAGSTTEMRVWSHAGGGGTVRSINMYTGSNTYQVHLTNDGKTGFGLAVPKTRVTIEGALTLKEQAAADGDNAAYGQLWTKDTTPNQLWFTDDAGTDLRVAPQDLQTSASPTFADLIVTDRLLFDTTNQNTYLGYLAAGNISGTVLFNVCVGEEAGRYLKHVSSVQGYYNVGIGHKANRGGAGGNSGIGNVALGASALEDVTSGYYNLGMATRALENLTTGDYNIGVGYRTLAAVMGQNNNLAIGYQAGMRLTGSNCVFFGAKAGYYQTSVSDILLIDNQQRTNAAEELTNSIIYGVMAATPAGQTLRINAAAIISQTLDVVGNIDPTSYETTRGGFKNDPNIATPSETAVISEAAVKTYIDGIASGGALGDLSDVIITSVANDEVLAYDSGSSKWINQTPTEANLLKIDGSNANATVNIGSQDFITSGTVTTGPLSLGGEVTTNIIPSVTGRELGRIGPSKRWDLFGRNVHADTINPTTTLVDLTIYAGSNTTQFVLKTTGNNEMSGDLKVAGTIRANTAFNLNGTTGVSGTLELDDGSTEKVTLVFTGGILTSRTVIATTGSVLINWTD